MVWVVLDAASESFASPCVVDAVPPPVPSLAPDPPPLSAAEEELLPEPPASLPVAALLPVLLDVPSVVVKAPSALVSVEKDEPPSGALQAASASAKALRVTRCA